MGLKAGNSSGRARLSAVETTAAIALGLATFLSAASSGVAQLRYSGDVSFSRGEYIFDQPVTSYYLGNRMSVQTNRFDFSVSLPVIVQEEGAITWVGGVPLPTGGQQHGVVAGRGSGTPVGTGRGRRDEPSPSDSVVVIDSHYSGSVGDPLLGLSTELYSGFGLLRSLRVGGRVKVPLQELGEGSGSGEWDYSSGVSMAFGVGGALGFVDASYWWIGDLPELELLNALSYGAGVLVPAFGDRASVMLDVTGSSKTIPTADPPVSVGASVGTSAGDRGFLSAGVTVGLTETAPDMTIQAGWSVGLFGLRR